MFIRPVNSMTFNSNYFLPNVGNSNHTIKFDSYWHNTNSVSLLHHNGFTTIRFPTNVTNNYSTQTSSYQINLIRDNNSVYDLLNIATFVQNTYTHDHMTAQLGIRYDRNHNQTLTSTIKANPLTKP